MVEGFVRAGPRRDPHRARLNHELMALLAWATSSVVGESEIALPAALRRAVRRRRRARDRLASHAGSARCGRAVPLPRDGLAAAAGHHPPGARLRARVPRDERRRRRRARGGADRANVGGRRDVRGRGDRRLDAAAVRDRVRRDLRRRCSRPARPRADGRSVSSSRSRRSSRGTRPTPASGRVCLADRGRRPDRIPVGRDGADRPDPAPGAHLDRRNGARRRPRLAAPRAARRDRRRCGEPAASRPSVRARPLLRRRRDDRRALDRPTRTSFRATSASCSCRCSSLLATGAASLLSGVTPAPGAAPHRRLPRRPRRSRRRGSR